MIPWEKRPLEIANLLNPAFCLLIMREAASEYSKEKAEGFPYVLTFLVLPIVLHRSTRETLPKTKSTKMHVWLEDNQNLRIGFAARVSRLVPYTREALVFGLQKGKIRIDENASVYSEGKLSRFAVPHQRPGDVSTCRDKAKFVGRWFANSGNTSTIFTMWGIKP